MALGKDAQTRLEETRGQLTKDAKQLRRNFALMLLEKLDAQIRRGRIANSPRKDSHDGLSAGS
jgi:hypothetical protein